MERETSYFLTLLSPVWSSLLLSEDLQQSLPPSEESLLPSDDLKQTQPLT